VTGWTASISSCSAQMLSRHSGGRKKERYTGGGLREAAAHEGEQAEVRRFQSGLFSGWRAGLAGPAAVL
jgi:hypothetical protein